MIQRVFLSCRRILRLLCVGIPLLYLAVFLNWIQICLITVASLISRKLSFTLNSFVGKIIWGYMQWVFEDLHAANITMSGVEDIAKNESALVLSNHCSLIDFYLLHSLARRKNMLGYNRYFAKDSLKYIPMFGWGMYMMGMLMIKRNWTRDQKTIHSYFDLYVRHKVPVWVTSYLEGTRLTETKLEESKAYSAKHGHPILKNLLLPRTKGFIATVSALRSSHVKYVYDVTIAYYHKEKGFGAKPSLLQIHYGDLDGYEFHVHVQKFNMCDLPDQDSKLSAWVFDRFKEKDALLERLKTHWPSKKNL